jgi:hypothetical protein
MNFYLNKKMNILPETAGLFEPGGVGLTDTR